MRRTADSDVGAQDRTNRGPFSDPASASLHFTVAVVDSPCTRRHTNGPDGGIFAAHYASHSPAHSASLQLSVGQGTPRCHRGALPSHSGWRGACSAALTCAICGRSPASSAATGSVSGPGVGEAKPIGVMHELGHSYWGGFPVIGRPELGWEKANGAEVAPALASYHQDILTFMAQPPDDYEFLRQRLRRLPEVSSENPEPLFHSLEADLPYTTGGDLGLVPPVLRRYWGHFLGEGPFGTWERAVGLVSVPVP